MQTKIGIYYDPTKSHNQVFMCTVISCEGKYGNGVDIEGRLLLSVYSPGERQASRLFVLAITRPRKSYKNSRTGHLWMMNFKIYYF